MNTTTDAQHFSTDQTATTHVDVLIVGAGISGIGGAWHLKHHRPDTSYLILESKENFGGTWRTHKYPGIRSDSDLYTFGYAFKPWVGPPIATAEEILKYVGEVIDENNLDQQIRYRHLIESASWSSKDNLWTLSVVQLDTGKRLQFTCNFLWMCQGYYNHDQNYQPKWAGMSDFKGQIVHPQHWPDDLDYSDMRVVVIGSGATAATVVPAMAGKCKHVTMLQRSPTYFATGRNANELADTLREIDTPEEWIHWIVRRKVLFDQQTIVRRSFEEPDKLREDLLTGVRQYLGDDFDVEKHFSPSYRPWHQRLAFIPDGDLFVAIRDGHASVVTDDIERFDVDGIVLKSGERLDADLIVTATGFNLNVMGDIAFDVDGDAVDFAKTVAWNGTMFSGVPNLLWVFGYFRASWTLRVDLLAGFLCRLLDEMNTQGAQRVTPMLRDSEQDMPLQEWITADNFNPGYVRRSIDKLPRQGDRPPWLHTQDFARDETEMPKVDLNDGSLRYD